MPTFEPVDHDPFAATTPATSSPSTTPVDYDPFAQPQSASPNVKSANDAFLTNNQGFGLGEKIPTRAELPNRAARVGLGMAEPFVGTAQFASHATGYGTQSTDAAANWIAQKEAQKKAEAGLTPEDWDYWSGAGNIASPMNFVPGGAIARVVGPARSIVGAGLRGAAAGAGYGAMQPVTDITPENDYWSQKGDQTQTGAVTGGVTGLGAGALAKAISPEASRTAAQLTAEGADNAAIQHAEDLELAHHEGIRTTVGQATGLERSESIVGDIPIAGSMYRDRLAAFREDANRAALNRAVPPGAQPIQPGEAVGTQGIQKLERDFNTAYRDAHARMSLDAWHPSMSQFHTDLQTVVRNGVTDLADPELRRLEQVIQNQLLGPIRNHGGTLNGEQIQTINSKLRYLSRNYSKSQDPDKRMLGDAIDEARQAFSDALIAQNGQQAADRLRGVDLAYAHFVRVRAAAVAAKNTNGVFTGNQLLNATTQLNNSVGRGEIAAGRDPFYQDLAGMMIRLTPHMANSGSPERLARLALGHTLIGASGVALPVQTIAATGGLTAAYTGPGQRLLNAAITARPPGSAALGRTLRTYGPTAGTRALMTGKVGQDQEPEMLPPVRVEQASGGKVTHEQTLKTLEHSPLSPAQKARIRRKIIESAIREP